MRIGFFSPSNQQQRFGGTNFASTVSVSSSADVTFPQFAETGTWTISGLSLQDAAGNIANFSTADLAQKGFPNQLIMVGDNMPPTTTATASPGPNSYGWNNTNVTVTLSGTDNAGGSGVKQPNTIAEPPGAHANGEGCT
jgi:hypothetical protein